jgi:alkylation response protein AidB-like acyl-CoA dehydrogenase
MAHNSVAELTRATSPSVLDRARALRETFRSRIPETDRICRLPDETVADLEAGGFFKLLTPRRYGGLQMPLYDYMDVIVELGRADVSVAWTVNLINTNAWMVGWIFPEFLQDKVFNSPNPRGSCVLNPQRCIVRDAPGGKLVEYGIWRFNSGIYHAGWDIVTIPLTDDSGNVVDTGLALVPISDVKILDDWDTIGVRGSGSSTVELHNVFIPTDHIVPLSHGAGGSTVHPYEDELYHLPFHAATIILELPMLGGCEAALDIFMSKVHGRPILHSRYPDSAMAPCTHLALGEATAKIDAAKLLAKSTFTYIHDKVHNRSPFVPEDFLRMRRDAGLTSMLAWQGVDLLAEAAGASMMSSSHPLNRIWRDVRTGSLHAAQHPSSVFEAYGRGLCGLEP